MIFGIIVLIFGIVVQVVGVLLLDGIFVGKRDFRGVIGVEIVGGGCGFRSVVNGEIVEGVLGCRRRRRRLTFGNETRSVLRRGSSSLRAVRCDGVGGVSERV